MSKKLLSIYFMCILSIAESKVVNVIYFKPADIMHPIAKDIKSIREIIINTQTFYFKALASHKFKPKTFLLETDSNDQIIIRIVHGIRDLKEYSNLKLINAELPFEIEDKFWEHGKIRLIFLAGSKKIGVGARTVTSCIKNTVICGYTAYIPAEEKETLQVVTAHEIGHAFNLKHNSKDSLLMNPILNRNLHLSDFLLDFHEASFLNTHPFFIANSPKVYTHKPGMGKPTAQLWSSLKIRER